MFILYKFTTNVNILGQKARNKLRAFIIAVTGLVGAKVGVCFAVSVCPNVTLRRLVFLPEGWHRYDLCKEC